MNSELWPHQEAAIGSELGGTTDAHIIRRALDNPAFYPFVICTYQSFDLLLDICRTLPDLPRGRSSVTSRIRQFGNSQGGTGDRKRGDRLGSQTRMVENARLGLRRGHGHADDHASV